ncbi:MAG: hypothetical protein WCW31_02635 [Patescibacteria group bacterium]
MSAHLIQGFFFQEQFKLDIEHRGESEGGVHVVFVGGACRIMYAGTIWLELESGIFMGEMVDDFGNSGLSEITLGPDELKFSKKYEHRADVIKYSFRRQDSIWVGEYEGKKTGKGWSNCVLTEVPDTLFVALPAESKIPVV